MDYYLVSVFQNQGLNAVLGLCDQGKQNIKLRNDLLVWAIIAQENTLAKHMCLRSDMHCNSEYPLRAAILSNNSIMVDELLGKPPQGGSLSNRFLLLEQLTANPNAPHALLVSLAQSFSQDVFDGLYSKRKEDAARQEEWAQWWFKKRNEEFDKRVANGVKNARKPDLNDIADYQAFLEMEQRLERVVALRCPQKKPKM